MQVAYRRLIAIMKKELIQMTRDRLTLAMMLMFPLFQLAIFGFAINTDVKHVPLVVLDRSESWESRRLVQAFTNSKYFDVVARVDKSQDVATLIDSGKAKVGLVIDSDYAKDMLAGRTARAQVVVDASDPITAASTMSHSQGIALATSLPIIYKFLPSAAAQEAPELPVALEVRGWFNPDLVTANYIVPGLIGVILAMTMMMITSMAIVKEREVGTLEQLMTTPIRSWELMVGKIAPYIGVGYIQITIALLVGLFVFKVPMRGSLMLLYAVSLVYIGCYLGIGLTISTVARTQQQALQIAFFIFLPTILLSGFMFPVAGMPKMVQLITSILPLTYYLEILRGIVLKGVGTAELLQYIYPLLLLLSVIMTTAILRFRKSLD